MNIKKDYIFISRVHRINYLIISVYFFIRYFNSLLVDHIGDDELINVGVPKFVRQVADLLQHVDNRTLANYMVNIYDKYYLPI